MPYNGCAKSIKKEAIILLLELKEIQKAYGKQLILKDIHLSLVPMHYFSLSILVISIATLFTRNIIKKASTAWLSLSFVLLITIASIRLKKEMPELLWVFPPINSFLMLGQYEHHLLVHVLWLTAWALIYSLLLITLFLFLVQKNDFKEGIYDENREVLNSYIKIYQHKEN